MWWNFYPGFTFFWLTPSRHSWPSMNGGIPRKDRFSRLASKFSDYYFDIDVLLVLGHIWREVLIKSLWHCILIKPNLIDYFWKWAAIRQNPVDWVLNRVLCSFHTRDFCVSESWIHKSVSLRMTHLLISWLMWRLQSSDYAVVPSASCWYPGGISGLETA